MTFITTFANPAYCADNAKGKKLTIETPNLSIQEQFRQVGTCNITFDNSLLTSLYINDTDDNNPIQLKSIVSITRDSKDWFQGEIVATPVELTSDSRSMTVEIESPLTVLKNTKIVRKKLNEETGVYEGEYEYGFSSTAIKLENVVLFQILAGGTEKQATNWYFDPNGTCTTTAPDGTVTTKVANSKLYYSSAGSVHKLTKDVSLVDTTLQLEKVNPDFPMSGFVVIGTEWIYYDGYTRASGYYVINNCVRGVLGTTTAKHYIDDVADFKLCKELAPDWGYEVLKSKYTDFRVDKDTKVTDAQQDIKSGTWYITPETGYYYRANICGIYDSDKVLWASSVNVDLADIVKDWVSGDVEFGGAGFTAAQYSIPTTGIVFGKIDYKIATYGEDPFTAITRLLDNTSGNLEICIMWDHGAKKLVLKTLSQKEPASTDMTIAHSDITQMPRDLLDVASGLLIEWKEEQEFNYAVPGLSWHMPASGQDSNRLDAATYYAAWGVRPHRWVEYTETPPKVEKSYQDTTDDLTCPEMIYERSGGGGGQYRVPDSSGAEEIQELFGYEPCDMFYFWFDGKCKTISLDKIVMVINTNTGNNYGKELSSKFSVEATTQFNLITRTLPDNRSTKDYPNAPDPDNWFPVGGSLQFVRVPWGNIAVIEATDFAERNINGLRIKVYDATIRKRQADEKYAEFFLDTFKALGSVTKYMYVQIREDGTQLIDYPQDLEAAKQYLKLRHGLNNAPKVKHVNAGTSSEGAIKTLANQYLQELLKLYEKRVVTTSEILDHKPLLGETYTANELGTNTYTGLCRGYVIEARGTDPLKYEFDILNADAAMIGE
jgi:hypothetical protein